MTKDQNDNTEYFEVLKEEDLDNIDIIDYLFYVCGYLLDTDYGKLEKKQITESLEIMSEEMELICSFYDEMKPIPGGNTARKTVFDIALIMKNAVEDLIKYIEEKNEKLIESGIEKLETADSMIDTLKETISHRRMELAEILSKIQKGEFKEGEPIILTKSTPLSVTDEDIKKNENDIQIARLTVLEKIKNRHKKRMELHNYLVGMDGALEDFLYRYTLRLIGHMFLPVPILSLRARFGILINKADLLGQNQGETGIGPGTS
jgi:hypothetical protein